MLVLTLPALALEFPREFHGHYIEPAVLESWFTEEPLERAPPFVEVWSDAISVVEGGQTEVGSLSGIDAGRYTIEWAGKPLTLTFTQSRAGDVRVEWPGAPRVHPHRRLVAMHGRDIDAIPAWVTLSRGWVSKGRAYVFVPGTLEHVLVGQGTARGRPQGVFELNGTRFSGGLDAEGWRLVEVEAIAREPGVSDVQYRPVDGGETLELRPMDVPPFVAMVDATKVRAAPKGAPIGSVDAGSPVRVWTREGDWALVATPTGVGWMPAAHLARRVYPVEGPGEQTEYASAFADRHPVIVGPSGCEVGPSTPPVDRSTSAWARWVDLDGEAPLDVVCGIEGEVRLVCPILRAGDGVEHSPCGVVPERPEFVGSRTFEGSQALVLGDTVYPRTARGWLDGRYPGAPAPDAKEEPSTAEGSSGCLCVSAPVVPLSGLVLAVLLLARRRR